MPSSQELDQSEREWLQAALDNRYTLVRLLGRGAMGVVYLARDRRLQRLVAIKTLLPEFSGDPDRREQFRREALTNARLAHPNIVPVYSIEDPEGLLYLVMRYIHGQSLGYRLWRRRAIPIEEVCQILADLASALDYAHRQNVVHRDIKPENIMVGRRDGQPHAVLTDLGLARPLHSPKLTRTGELSGTPAYVAPEVLSGRPAQPAGDVYSLGVVAYELLAGRLPFQADTAVAMMRAHLEDEPQRPPGWGDALWTAVSACLAKDPARRPSANALRFLFQGLGNGDAQLLPTVTASRPAPPPPPAAPARRRRPYRWIAIGVVCALLGAAAGVAYQYARRPRPVPEPVQPVAYTYFLPVSVSSPQAGAIELAFAEATGLPGFHSYLIFRDDINVLASVPPGNGVPPYRYTAPDHETAYCYRVAALLYTQTPPQSLDIAPVCKAANGKP